MRLIRHTALLALGAAALVAPVAANAAAPIKISEKEFVISGMPKTLKHGVLYTVDITNKGKLHHDLLFDGKRLDDHGIHNAHSIAPGGTASFTIKFPQAGTYNFYCAIKGHAMKGMKGTVKVT